MNHDDDRIDATLEALARPQPPADHVARVLARTSAAGGGPAPDTHDVSASAYLRPRLILPVAATVVAVLAATWQIGQQAGGAVDSAIADDASADASGRPRWEVPEEVIQPVLPPQAYWGMDPFQEFATLRPGTRVTARGVTSAAGVRDSIVGPSLTAGRTVPDDELAWEPMPSGLPPIELISIAQAPLAVPAVAPLEDITLAEIPLAPIVIAPLDDQE